MSDETLAKLGRIAEAAWYEKDAGNKKDWERVAEAVLTASPRTDEIEALRAEVGVLQSIVRDIQIRTWDLDMSGRHAATAKHRTRLSVEQWGAVYRARDEGEEP